MRAWLDCRRRQFRANRVDGILHEASQLRVALWLDLEVRRSDLAIHCGCLRRQHVTKRRLAVDMRRGAFLLLKHNRWAKTQ